MGLGVLLVPALAGYFLQIRLNIFRYHTLRESGQHVVFRSALTGSILVFFAQLLIYSVGGYAPSPVAYLNNAFGFEYTAAAVLSFFLALLIWPIANLIVNKDEAAIRAAKDNGELVGIFVTKAIGTGKYVEISLDTGKVYIGHIVESGIGVRSEFDLMIVPVISGYRASDTNDLKITHFYDRAITDSIANGQDWQEFRIGVSLGRVVLVRFFNLRLYRAFLSEQEPEN